MQMLCKYTWSFWLRHLSMCCGRIRGELASSRDACSDVGRDWEEYGCVFGIGSGWEVTSSHRVLSGRRTLRRHLPAQPRQLRALHQGRCVPRPLSLCSASPPSGRCRRAADTLSELVPVSALWGGHNADS